MRYKDVQTGQTFFFEDNYSYPKRKIHHGHLDIRDGVTGYMPDDFPVVTLAELAALRAENAKLREALIKAESALTYANWDGVFDDSHTAQDVINARDSARRALESSNE